MLLLGLTGSIATGKSTTSALLSSPPYNLPIVDADLIARQVVEPGRPAYHAIVSHFLPSTPDLLLEEYTEQFPNTGKGKWINRPALGRRVFGSGEGKERDRKTLNGIVHPAVRKDMGKQVLMAYLRGCWAVVLDVPLLFEGGLDGFCGTVMVVGCSPEVQMDRLMKRDTHLSKDEARERVGSQGSVEEKVKRVEARGPGRGVVVWNEQGKAELEKELSKAMESIRGASPRWWGWLLLAFPPLAGMAGFWALVRNWRINQEWKEGQRREKAKL